MPDNPPATARCADGTASKSPSHVATRALVATLPALLTLACSGSGEDVRVTLCKDIVAVRASTKPIFETPDIRTRGYQGAEVRLAYRLGDQAGSATCVYAYNAVDDTADQLANPLNAFATSPERVVLDGQTLSRPALAEAVKQAMLKQGRQFLKEASDQARNAITQ